MTYYLKIQLMLSISVIELGILAAIFLIAGALVYLRSELSRYDIPVIMLALFALTSGVLVPVFAYSEHREANTIDYRVESQVEGCDTGDPERVHEFDDLSPDAQDVFLSALESDRSYATTVTPDEYDVSYDPAPNYIRYESDCYSLLGSAPHSAGTVIGIYALLLFAIPLIAVLAILAAYSYRVDSFRIPATAVSGIVIGVGGHAVVDLRLLIPACLLIAAAVWILLDDFKPLK